MRESIKSWAVRLLPLTVVSMFFGLTTQHLLSGIFFSGALNLALLLLLGLSVAQPRYREAWRNPYLASYALLVLVLLLSMWQLRADTPWAASYRYADTLKQLVYTLTMVWAVSVVIDRPQRLALLAWPLFAALLCFEIAVGIDLWQQGSTIDWISMRFRFVSPMILLMLCLPLAWVFARNKALKVLVALVFFSGIALMFSFGMRTAWLIAFGAACLWLSYGRFTWAIFSIAALLVVLLAYQLQPDYALSRLQQSITDLSGRYEYCWQPALTMIADRPWFGFGFGGHYPQVLAYYGAFHPWSDATFRMSLAHNFYLQMLWYLGGVGALLVFASIVCLFVDWCRAWPSRWRNGVAATVLYYVLGSLLLFWYGIKGNSEKMDLPYFAVVFAFAAAWWNIRKRAFDT